MDKVVDEIEAKQRAERRQIIEDAELFQGLLTHKGWPRYVALVEAMAQNYHAIVMRPLELTYEVTKPEFAKGVLNGLSIATAAPGMKIAEARTLQNVEDEQ